MAKHYFSKKGGYIILGLIILSSVFIGLFLLSSTVSAAGEPTPPNSDYENALTSGTPILEKGDLISMILEAIRTLLVFTGATVLIMIIFSGLKWMMSGGNEEQMKKAKMTLRNALIGLTICILAYAIATWGITSLHGGIIPPMLFFL